MYPPFFARLAIGGAVLLFLCQTGCVRRRMTVRSYPEGATVYVDHREMGKTPVSFPFTYYGTREIRLEKDANETVKVRQKINAPWYQMPGLDFVSENLWPAEIRDERVLDFQLPTQQKILEADVHERAERLRTSQNQGFVAPLLPSNSTIASPVELRSSPVPRTSLP